MRSRWRRRHSDVDRRTVRGPARPLSGPAGRGRYRRRVVDSRRGSRMTESLDTSLVDRSWQAWMAVRGRLYRPTAQDPDTPAGQRLDDVMTTLLGEAVRP